MACPPAGSEAPTGSGRAAPATAGLRLGGLRGLLAVAPVRTRDAPVALPDRVAQLQTLPVEQAGRLLRTWLEGGQLREDAQPALYVLEQTSPDGASMRGLVGALAVSEPGEPGDGAVLPHEEVDPAAVAARLARLRALRTEPEPITLLWDDASAGDPGRPGAGSGSGAALDLLRRSAGARPRLWARTPDGHEHRLWEVRDPVQIADVGADLLPRRAIVADGHHRWAALREERRWRHSTGQGAGPWDAALAMLVPAGDAAPGVRPFHRVLLQVAAPLALRAAAATFHTRELPAVPWTGRPLAPERAALLARQALAAMADLPPHRPGGRPPGEQAALVLSDGIRAWLLEHPAPDAVARARPAQADPLLWDLDAMVVEHLLLERLLGVHDEPGKVEPVADPAEALLLAQRTGATAVLVRPPPAASVLALARRGQRVPRKTTLFTPKPRGGLLMRRR